MPKCQTRHVVPTATDMVRQFYAAHDIYRIIPGIKDYVPFNSTGKKFIFRND
jgi:hypothetical protein